MGTSAVYMTVLQPSVGTLSRYIGGKGVSMNSHLTGQALVNN